MKKKLIGVFCVCLSLFTVLYVKISWISFDSNLKSVGLNQASYSLPIETTRGQIYDCRLLPLVGCDKEYRAIVLPTPQNVLLLDKISAITAPSQVSQNGLPFVTTVPLPTVNIPQVTVIPTDKRYSKTQLAQHLIGYYDPSQNKGISGTELKYNDLLAKNSATSTISYQLDGRRQPLIGVEPSISLAPVVQSGVVLTIDKRIQQVVEESGNRHIKKGAIVVLEPSTGKIKAIASFPSYNANNLQLAMANTDSPLINRATSAYSVGSVFKLVTAATALESGILPDFKYTCSGEIELNKTVFRCHKKTGHGEINMREAIAVSCNPYFINLSTHIDKQKFIDMAYDLSFGKGGYAGNLPTSSELKNIGDVANLSFGQGSLTATPIQVSELISAIVNDGKAIKSTTVEGTTNDGKTIDRLPEPFPTVSMSKTTAHILKEMMTNAVMNTPNQNSTPYNVSAGGKTATAQTGQFNGDVEILNAWFAGFFPANKPKYVVTVFVEDAQSGNQDASPVFREIVESLNSPFEY